MELSSFEGSGMTRVSSDVRGLSRRVSRKRRDWGIKTLVSQMYPPGFAPLSHPPLGKGGYTEAKDPGFAPLSHPPLGKGGYTEAKDPGFASLSHPPLGKGGLAFGPP